MAVSRLTAPWLLLALALSLGGCASSPPLEPLAAGRDAVELSDVPFHPQERYQCGPAALATVLGWSGVAVSPEELVARLYVPARQGSLQPEVQAQAQPPAQQPPADREPAAADRSELPQTASPLAMVLLTGLAAGGLGLRLLRK